MRPFHANQVSMSTEQSNIDTRVINNIPVRPMLHACTCTDSNCACTCMHKCHMLQGQRGTNIILCIVAMSFGSMDQLCVVFIKINKSSYLDSNLITLICDTFPQVTVRNWHCQNRGELHVLAYWDACLAPRIDTPPCPPFINI